MHNEFYSDFRDVANELSFSERKELFFLKKNYLRIYIEINRFERAEWYAAI